MKIALLGYGKEGKATEKYFKSHFKDATFDIFENLTPTEFATADYSPYDYIFRSPSIPPFNNPKLTSVTKYFFDHCPCRIIGVTATKGKGTTCSFIKALLDAEGYDTHLVGNIGNPAIDVLDQLRPDSVVVYEMSSFQLWDLEKSPFVAVIGHLEPDHLNIHKDYAEYLSAKGNIARFQTSDDYCVYNTENPKAIKLSFLSPAHKVPYPFSIPDNIRDAIKLPGEHNIKNAMAAIAAVASFKNISPDEYIHTSAETIMRGLSSFHGLPHRLEFVRELHGVKYYDDNFSTNPSSTRVAVNAFPDSHVILIIGGRDKTNNEDLPEINRILQSQNIASIILIGESGHALAKRYNDPRFISVSSLEEAVKTASNEAKNLDHPIVLMSPAAASFDMFKDVYDRGDQFQALVKNIR
ncbi:UDP-N-acetylmuramoyl-L-alanine--D-glutamate ligase [Candidatus Saccharibacteria bacterium]|nr:UDP-N-acetylmuramoyl-L-alanine--D-glutamate ligase [Candidatus Saccharibacteria bacterium]